MRHNLVMSWRTNVGAVLAAVVSATQIVTAPAGSAQESVPVPGGRVVVGTEQYPFRLNHWHVCCTLQWTEWMVDVLLPDAYERTPDHAFVPEVLAEEAEVTLDPFSVTYRIRPEATWNDGVAVSARDFVFTWRTFTDQRVNVWSRDGYEMIREATIVDPKTVTFTFRRAYPEYKLLFQDVFPRHVLHDKNMNRVWGRQIPVSAGPFEFGEFERQSHLTLVRNDNYWGDHPAYLDEVEFRFFPGLEALFDAFQAGEVDVIYPYLSPAFAGGPPTPGTEVQTSPGPYWEHIDFSFRRAHRQPPFVRRAVATAIDREAILTEVIRPIDPDAQVLQSLIFAIGEPGYEEHFASYDGDVTRARQMLEDHGCEADADGIYVCNGRRLTLTYHTTRLNPLRKQVAHIVRDQLDDAGIHVEVRRRDPSILFGYQVLVLARYDLIEYAWLNDELSFDRAIWSCRGRSNFTMYCNDDVTALLREASTELDTERRLRLANDADQEMARDMVSLPLYQRPTYLAYEADLEGLIDNPTAEGFTWNIEDWWRQS